MITPRFIPASKLHPLLTKHHCPSKTTLLRASYFILSIRPADVASGPNYFSEMYAYGLVDFLGKQAPNETNTARFYHTLQAKTLIADEKEAFMAYLHQLTISRGGLTKEKVLAILGLTATKHIVKRFFGDLKAPTIHPQEVLQYFSWNM